MLPGRRSCCCSAVHARHIGMSFLRQSTAERMSCANSLAFGVLDGESAGGKGERANPRLAANTAISQSYVPLIIAHCALIIANE